MHQESRPSGHKIIWKLVIKLYLVQTFSGVLDLWTLYNPVYQIFNSELCFDVFTTFSFVPAFIMIQ